MIFGGDYVVFPESEKFLDFLYQKILIFKNQYQQTGFFLIKDDWFWSYSVNFSNMIYFIKQNILEIVLTVLSEALGDWEPLFGTLNLTLKLLAPLDSRLWDRFEVISWIGESGSLWQALCPLPWSSGTLNTSSSWPIASFKNSLKNGRAER